MFSLTPSRDRSSSMSKPLSAITESSLSNKSKRPLRLVSSLSEIQPGYRSETKTTAPDGDIPLDLCMYYDFYMKKMLVVATQECLAFQCKFPLH